MKPNPKFLSFYYETMTEFPDIKLDPKKTALLIVDMQNEFILRDFGEALQFKEMGECDRWIPFHDRLDDITIPAIISAKTICMSRSEELPVFWKMAKTGVWYRNLKAGTECCSR